ncbi:MAG TPA: hypothetical protein VHH15_06400 [Actinophytocola sp.]|nr:hypothetical protein [Actinophytocola sp.]
MPGAATTSASELVAHELPAIAEVELEASRRDPYRAGDPTGEPAPLGYEVGGQPVQRPTEQVARSGASQRRRAVSTRRPRDRPDGTSFASSVCNRSIVGSGADQVVSMLR